MMWLVLPTLAAATTRCDELSEATGYPNPETRTVALTVAMAHPTNGKGAVPVSGAVWSWVAESKINAADLLTQSERDALIDQEQFEAGGWYPPLDPPS